MHANESSKTTKTPRKQTKSTRKMSTSGLQCHGQSTLTWLADLWNHAAREYTKNTKGERKRKNCHLNLRTKEIFYTYYFSNVICNVHHSDNHSTKIFGYHGVLCSWLSNDYILMLWTLCQVCGHKWVDLSEHDWGVALMTNCKYGYSTHGNVMYISL